MMWEWHPAACFWTHRATCQNIQPVSATHLANTLDMIRMKIALPLQSQRTAEATSRHADVFSTQGWIRKTARHGILLVTAVMLAACQPPMRLMPSPLAFTQGGKQLSADGVAARNGPRLGIFGERDFKRAVLRAEIGVDAAPVFAGQLVRPIGCLSKRNRLF